VPDEFMNTRSARTVAEALTATTAATSVVGSFLVMSDTTGYFFAGLVSAFGFGLIGVWLVVISRSGDLPAAPWALIAGAVMRVAAR
jgi:hypothetical protein